MARAAEAPMGGPDRTVGEDSAVGNLWCQGKRLQGIVVGLRGCEWREQIGISVTYGSSEAQSVKRSERWNYAEPEMALRLFVGLCRGLLPESDVAARSGENTARGADGEARAG